MSTRTLKGLEPPVTIRLYRRRFRKGLNFFVSFGLHLPRILEAGDFFKFEGWDGVAQAVGVYQTSIGRLPDEVFRCYHDPVGRSRKGLIQILREIRKKMTRGEDDGSESVTDDTLVVAVGFYLYRSY